MAKQRFAVLSDFVDAIMRRDGRRQDVGSATRDALSRPAIDRISAACHVLMTRIGDAARVAVAEQALSAYEELSDDEKLTFFRLLLNDYGVDADEIRGAYQTWEQQQDGAAGAALFQVVEPKRQTLLRRLNMAPGATLKLVRMREDLLKAMRGAPEIAPIDQDFAHLLSSWFNRGFLRMQRIDWGTSAAVLERIMRYESVHVMQGWADLRRRLNPHDRRMFAFFHPATGDEPLIFVEVALTQGVPDAIATILTAPEPDAPAQADTAVFYSINNSLPGLKGVSFGNFLIKQVASDLSKELPELTRFVTLSPAPGFARWLAAQESVRAKALSTSLKQQDWLNDDAIAEELRPEVEAFAARYFVTARNQKDAPPDPVARFHLGNGASAWRVNWPADRSDNAVRAAHGLMINYLYELAAIETQHELFVRDGTVAHGPSLADALQRISGEE
ncbi:malonyl-CoA decarboxylase family protein [Paracoccus sp. SCSIO 75233]|uniref:malonyl-CoA decarboxylase domain-containing protein n=1 Tax=Paracoccus sp. SCSIO 75233 TaxID=3017782 RepID=UPI0022F02C3F|nr:malonyl-CoA decarboxylase family protein [Paracoccus sp. SCSIO 75233]WBU52042.1 malonyl-CoA decarboxylase family protein [Paracoccus sp. SCSIO 75233]